MAEAMPERWQQRFETYEKCLALLREAIELAEGRMLSELEKAGFVKRYELTWEYGWKTLGDFLRQTEEPDLPFASGSVLRLAAALGLIDDGDVWLKAGKLRNTLTHEYNEARRDEGLALIAANFLPMMERLRATMRERL